MAFVVSVPIGLLGGLIGLGGAEFRLPVLAGPLGYRAKQAVAINLAISLVTIVSALIVRSRTLSVAPLEPLLPTMAAMIVGAMSGAVIGTTLVGRLSEELLERVILVFLVTIGAALIVEGFLTDGLPALVPDVLGWRVATGLAFGILIGIVSSMLGVAGGELIIPTLIFAYGVNVKVAGTASLMISLPTVLVGVLRYARRQSYTRQPLVETVAPMSAGSVIGAILGGLLVGIVSPELLKVGLGLILIGSAARIFHRRTGTSA